MKKLIAVIFIILPLACSAQWHVGGKASVSFSNYKTKTPWKEIANTGFAAGFTAFKQVKINMGYSIGLEFIQKGYNHKICNTITDELEANYLEVPIMLNYTFLIPGVKNFKGHANAGFYTAYWISGKYKTQGFSTQSEDFNFESSEASRFDLGPSAGGRIEYVLRNGAISLDLRYELGLLDLQKKVSDNTRNTNRTFIIGISYLKLLNM